MSRQEVVGRMRAVSRAGYTVLIALIALCVGIEGGLQLAETFGLGPSRLRSQIYENGGFWVGLLSSWTPNYPLQPYLMFLTYGFLHGGFAHLFVNMVTLWSISIPVLKRVGVRGFVLLYVGTLFGGAAGYALLAKTFVPMVGASGALFGLVGGLLAWAYVDRYAWKEALWPVARAVILLLALNLVLWWAMGGQLAWETHLGGFLAGWVLALLIDPRPRQME